MLLADLHTRTARADGAASLSCPVRTHAGLRLDGRAGLAVDEAAPAGGALDEPAVRDARPHQADCGQHTLQSVSCSMSTCNLPSHGAPLAGPYCSVRWDEVTEVANYPACLHACAQRSMRVNPASNRVSEDLGRGERKGPVHMHNRPS